MFVNTHIYIYIYQYVLVISIHSDTSEIHSVLKVIRFTRAQSPTGPDPRMAPLAPNGRHRGEPRLAPGPGEGPGENPVPDARAKRGLDSSVYIYVGT